MTSRQTRRTAAVLAIVAAVSVTTAAATQRQHHPGFFGVDWIAGMVVGARYVLLMCGVALAVLARGLLYGKRTARRLTLVCILVAADGLRGHAHHLAPMVALALLGAVLVVGRGAFSAGTNPVQARQGWWILVAGECTVLLYGVVGLHMLARDFREPPTVTDSIVSGARLLFLLPAGSIPATRHGAFFIESVRVASLTVAIIGLARIVATAVARSGHADAERAAAQALLDRWATNGLAPFFLTEDKSWWFATDRSAVLAYVVVRRAAVVLGEPVGEPAGCVDAARGFVEFCDRNGWIVGFHQVTDAGRALLADAGLRALKIGEDAVIPVDQFELSSARHKSLRSALRRVERAGYRVVELPQPIDSNTMDELRRVSDSWLSSGGHRERRFTLGHFDPDYLRSTTVLALIGSDGRIAAFVNMLPSYGSGNGNFDLMRRADDAPNGAMEALFVAMIHRCKSLGLAGLELGMAPLVGLDQRSIAGRALSTAYEHGRSAFNFGGLWSFKQKWDPVWEPRYLCYRAGVDLPTLATAVVRAGELPDTRSLVDRLRDHVRRFPVATAIIGLDLYVMAATTVDTDLHPQLVGHFAFGWHDLVHLQLWRLLTSTFVPDRAGFAVGNLIVLVPALCAAERRFGSRMAATIFGFGDIASTLAVLVLARLAGVLGSAPALSAALHRDSGSSSAGFALCAALAEGLPAGRVRNAAVVGLACVLAGALAVHHAEADVQHLVAAACGVVIVALSTRRTAAR